MTITPLTIGSSSSGTDRTVRPAVPSDAPSIARIQRLALAEAARAALADHLTSSTEASEHTAGGGQAPASAVDAVVPDEATVASSWEETLSAPAPEGCVTLVAIHGTAVGGFALAIPDDEIPEIPGKRDAIPAGTLIAALEVDPNFHRSGHASRLVSAVKDTVGRHNLRIWVSASDDARQQFVQSAGFAPAGIKRHLKVGDGELIEHLWWAQI